MLLPWDIFGDDEIKIGIDNDILNERRRRQQRFRGDEREKKQKWTTVSTRKLIPGKYEENGEEEELWRAFNPDFDYHLEDEECHEKTWLSDVMESAKRILTDAAQSSLVANDIALSGTKTKKMGKYNNGINEEKVEADFDNDENDLLKLEATRDEVLHPKEGENKKESKPSKESLEEEERKERRDGEFLNVDYDLRSIKATLEAWKVVSDQFSSIVDKNQDGDDSFEEVKDSNFSHSEKRRKRGEKREKEVHRPYHHRSKTISIVNSHELEEDVEDCDGYLCETSKVRQEEEEGEEAVEAFGDASRFLSILIDLAWSTRVAMGDGYHHWESSANHVVPREKERQKKLKNKKKPRTGQNDKKKKQHETKNIVQEHKRIVQLEPNLYNQDNTNKNDHSSVLWGDGISCENPPLTSTTTKPLGSPLDYGSSILSMPSATLQIVSETASVFAGLVRIVGDTTGATAGSSARIVGSAVKSLGEGLNQAGDFVEGEDENLNDLLSKASSSSSGKRQDHNRRGKKRNENPGTNGVENDLVHSTRHVAGQSLRLVGNIASGVGDALFFVGSKTEQITSMAAEVAEDTIRLVEDITGSLSATISGEGDDRKDDNDEDRTLVLMDKHDKSIEVTNGKKKKKKEKKKKKKEEEDVKRIVSYGIYPSTQENTHVMSQQNEEMENLSKTDPNRYEKTVSFSFPENLDHVKILLETTRSWLAQTVESALSKTEGVNSLAFDLLGVLTLCYVMTVGAIFYVRFSTTSTTKMEGLSQDWRKALVAPNEEEKVDHISNSDNPDDSLVHQDDDDDNDSEVPSVNSHDSGLVLSSPIQQHPSPPLPEMHLVHSPEGEAKRPRLLLVTTSLKFAAKLISFLLLMPIRILFGLLRLLYRIIFRFETVFLVVYGMAWLYLSHVSQERAVEVQRHAEAQGFRNAATSLLSKPITSSSSPPTLSESVSWLNTLLTEMWRVEIPSKKNNNNPQEMQLPSTYQNFIFRGIDNTTRQSSGKSTASDYYYGGLEPYLSSKIGTLLSDVLETCSEDLEVASVSIYSFTLGSVPPMIREVALKKKSTTRRSGGLEDVVDLDVDMDVLLSDLSLVLEINLSSLDYSLIPSTKVSIHGLDVRLPLDVSLTASSKFPFISTMNVSLSELPKCMIKITPLSENSGLQGVDLSSLPLLKGWVQEKVQATLAQYVSPRYVSVDFISFFAPIQPIC